MSPARVLATTGRLAVKVLVFTAGVVLTTAVLWWLVIPSGSTVQP